MIYRLNVECFIEGSCTNKSLGSWSLAGKLRTPRDGHRSLFFNNRIYSFGGILMIYSLFKSEFCFKYYHLGYSREEIADEVFDESHGSVQLSTKHHLNSFSTLLL